MLAASLAWYSAVFLMMLDGILVSPCPGRVMRVSWGDVEISKHQYYIYANIN